MVSCIINQEKPKVNTKFKSWWGWFLLRLFYLENGNIFLTKNNGGQKMESNGKKPTKLDAKLFLIGETSKRSGPCPNTIKSYIRQAIVEDVRDGRGRRVFSLNDISKLRAYYEARNPERIDR